MKYAVTGSTGNLGFLVVKALLDKNVPPSSIVAIGRTQSKAGALSGLGVEVRLADYMQPATLTRALLGVNRLLLVSGSEVGKRLAQHQNVLDAARKAGVSFLAYTSLSHASDSTSPLAPEHKATEEAIARSGIAYAILRNNWYTENYVGDVKAAQNIGIIAAAVGEGRVASASRKEYAEAAAIVLAGEERRNKIFELAGKAWNYHDLAQAAAAIWGRSVSFLPVSADERKKSLLALGLPLETADFIVALDKSIEAGVLAKESEDLEKIIGRKPEGLLAGLRAALK
jgi:NAD(P)H dehydrogenase (quinone)